jgi:DNA-directed RNA polymerase, mitochondrial
MIPVSRTCLKRLDTTLVSYSRQSLPRPARLYSTPSKARYAPAVAAQTIHAPIDYSASILHSEDPSRGSDVPPRDDMHGFLKRRIPYTILPPPLPEDQTSSLNDFYFTDSPTQDSLAVIDACLHNLYDVPRAKQVFERLRKSGKGDATVDVRLYNSFLEAFISMATHKDTENRVLWLEDAWTLFDAMESGKNVPQPDANTYSAMLVAWLRFVQ